MPDTSETNISINTIWVKVYALIHEFWLMLPNIVLGLLVFFLFYVISRFCKRSIISLLTRSHSKNIGIVLGRVTQWGILALGLFAAFTIIVPSIKAVDMLTGLGFSGVALGFAFKNILQDYFAGILILLQEPFIVGDVIKVGDFEGTVEKIDTKTTFLRIENGSIILIPNGEIFTKTLIINRFASHRKTNSMLSIHSKQDAISSLGEIRKAISNTSGVAKHPTPVISLIGVNFDILTISINWWALPEVIDQGALKTRVLENIDKVLNTQLTLAQVKEEELG